MSIKNILEKIDSMNRAEKKPTGPKFPGYWKGKDPASKSKSKMVGSAQESIVKDLHNFAKEKITEWQLQEKYNQYKEDNETYTGIDPIVRQRLGMAPATQDEIKSYIQKNIPAIRTGDGYLTTNTGVSLDPKKSHEPLGVFSGGEMDVLNAALKSALPSNVAKPATKPEVKPETKPEVKPEIQPEQPVELQRSVTVEPEPVKQGNIIAPPTTFRNRQLSDLEKRNVNALVDQLYADPENPPSPEELERILKSAGVKKSQPDSTVSKVTPNTVQNIAKLNQIENPNLIKVGQKIQLPDGRMYTVAKGDNLWNISRGKFKGAIPKANEALNEYGNAQDPNAQTTSPQQSNPAAQQQQQEKEEQDQRVDVAAAKSLASSIKPALPPTVDAGTVASALTKINDQNSGKPAKPLTQPEQMAMGPLNALFARAAETPQTSTELASILRNVNTLMKKGKA